MNIKQVTSRALAERILETHCPSGAISRLQEWRDTGLAPDITYCSGNDLFGKDVIAALAEIERLRVALTATVDALETLRRGHGAEVSALCFPALNIGRAALEKS